MVSYLAPSRKFRHAVKLVSKVTFAREKVVSAKNHFSGAGALMCVTREQYGVSRSGLHRYVQQRARLMVSISRYVKIIASGRFLRPGHI